MATLNKILILILIIEIAHNQVYCQPSPKKKLLEHKAEKITIPPKIDGALNDEAWKNLTPITEFQVLEPVFGSQPTQKTEVMVAYDDYAFYFGAQMYDTAPDSILTELGNRDDGSINADQFRVAFDTYDNQLDGYFFFCTASGVQIDYKLSDATYDGVWESAVKIVDDGWIAEFKIPFSAIRFPSMPEQQWSFQLARLIRRNREYQQWALVPKGVANSLNYYGKLNQIKDIKAPLRLSFTPYISSVYDHSPLYNAEESFSYSQSVSYNFGADMKYGIDERFTLDMTLMPDFSQVQTDNKIKNLSYSEVSYNENRQYFKEGTELFNKCGMFYSRRIGKTPSGFYDIINNLQENETIENNPSQVKLLNATKLSGRNNNKLGIGFFNAITDNAYAIIKDSTGENHKVKTEPFTNFNAVVFDQQLKNNSNVYFINTNVIRDGDAPDANVSGTGFTFFDKKITYAMDGFGVLSQKFTRDPANSDTYTNTMGYRYFIGARKEAGRLKFGMSHQLINKTYNPRDMGYYITPNQQIENLYIGFNDYEPNKIFRETYRTIQYKYTLNPLTGRAIASRLSIDHFSVLTNYFGLGLGAIYSPAKSYDYFEPRVDGRFSRIYRTFTTYFNGSSDYRKAIALDWYFEFGNYTEKIKGGENFTAMPAIRYRINDRMQFRYAFTYFINHYNIGYATIDSEDNIIYGGRKLETFENSLEGRYMFNNKMSINLYARHYWNTGKYKKYYLLQENGYLENHPNYTENHDYCYNAFNIDLVYSWQFAPGSWITLAYKNFIETENNVIETRYGRNFDRTVSSPQQNMFSFKVLYYLDYINLKKWRK